MKKTMTQMFIKMYLIGLMLLFTKTHGYLGPLNFKLRPTLTARNSRLQATSSDKTTNKKRESLLKVLRKLQTNREINIRDEYDTSEIANVILTHQQRPESSISQSYELNQIAELCSSLAEAGISSADLGVEAFKVVDGLVGSIPLTPLPFSSDNDSTTDGLMELLRGLHGMQVRWRTLSHTARGNLEALVAHTLASSLHTYRTSSDESVVATSPSNQKAIDNNHKSQLATLVLAMGHLKISYVDLTHSTRHLLGNHYHHATQILLQYTTTITT